VARVTFDGVPASTLARRWRVPHAAVFRTLTSSLDVVHDFGSRGAPHGTTVIAEEQTAGRGRDGRTWRSPEGGVWLGMLLRPGHVELGALSVRAGLVVADVVDELLGSSAARLKWPNDVLLGDRKLAGVLCETRWQGESPDWLALGVGVNVCNELPAELAQRAVALREFVPGLRRVDVLDRLVPALAAVAAGRPTLTESECRAFAERDWLRGRELRAPAAGRVRGLSPDGALLVALGADTIAVREGHVELV
jgi:BirA family transcriptional regulator, biotin operon repressor / biotin---[acetyl-CoA-carboxylase] ligase